MSGAFLKSDFCRGFCLVRALLVGTLSQLPSVPIQFPVFTRQQVRMRTQLHVENVCDAGFRSGWVFFTCPYCCLLIFLCVMNAECGTHSSSQIVIDRCFLFQILL